MPQGFRWLNNWAVIWLRNTISKPTQLYSGNSIHHTLCRIARRVSASKQALSYSLFSLLLMGGAQGVSANADLVLNHTVDKPSANATDKVVYTLRLTNNGPDSSDGIVLTDSLPATTRYVSNTSDQGTCSHSGETTGGIVTCNIGSLANSAEASVTITALITSSTPNTIANTASVTADTIDPDENNNTVLRNVTVISGTDLEMLLSGSPDPSVDSGGVLTYTASVNNLGPETAVNLSTTIQLAPGFTRTGPLPAGCNQSGQTVTCTSSSLSVGGSWNIGNISGVVSVAGTSQISTSASIGSGTFDGISDNNMAIVDSDVNATTDVSVSMTRSPAGSLVQLDEFTINLNPRYSGGQPQGLTMTATLDSAFQILNPGPIVQNGWSCAISGQVLTCTRTDGGGSTTGEFNHNIGQVTINVRAVGFGASLPNNVSISSSSPTDTNSSNNNFSLPITVQEPTFDLQALKSGPSQTLRVVDGESFPFTIRLRNNSNVAFAGELTMTDTLPAGLRVNSYSLNGWSCSSTDDPLPINGLATITCSRTYDSASPLAAGGTTPSVIMNTTATEVGVHSNQMCVSNTPESGVSYPADSVSANDCASSGIEGQVGNDSADIRLIKTGDATVVAGEVLTYQLEIVNDGPNAAQSVTLSDNFTNLFNGGPGNGFEGVTVSEGAATLGSCTNDAAANVTSRNLSCTFDTIPSCTQGSDCPVVAVAVRPMGNTLSGVNRTQNNTASAFSSVTSDSDFSNNEADHDTVITPKADLSAIKTANWSGSPAPVLAGTDLTYTITVHNESTGPSGASDIVITDTLPLNVTFVSAVASGGGNCTTTPGANTTTTVSNQELICEWSTIQRNGQRTVTIIVRPNNGTEGSTLINQVRSTTATPEVTLDNNDSNVSVTVADAEVDLATTQIDSPDPLQVGETVAYTLTVNNFGPSVASNVRLYNSLPTAGLTFQGFQTIDGTPGLPAGVSCSSPAVDAYGAGHVAPATYTSLGGGWAPALEAADIICEVDDLMLVNESVSFRILLKANEIGVYTNYVIARSQEHRDGKNDPNPANDLEPENTTVRIQADMEVVEKSPSLATVAVLQPFHYSVVVRNNGPNEALGVKLTDNLPSGMVLTGVPTVEVNNGNFETTGCSGVANESNVICDFGAVSIGAQATVTIPVRLSEWTNATISNTATVSVNNLTFDTDASNNDKTTDVTVERLTLAGRVYQKADPLQPNDPFNGTNDASIGGIAITVTGEDVDGNPINITRLTNADGTYRFDLPPSSPSGYSVSRGDVPVTVQEQGAQLGTGADSLGTVVNAEQMTTIVLNASNGTGIDYDFWIASTEISLIPPSVSGYVYFDRNRDRKRPTFPQQDPQVQGWGVTLWADLSGGGREEICRLQTDQYGFYQFDNLRCKAAGYDQWRVSGLPVTGGTSVVDSLQTYTNFSIEFDSEDGLAGIPQSGGSAGTPGPRNIKDIVLNPGQNITEQNLPLDPAGVIYDALTRQPVSGAQVFFEDQNGIPVNSTCLVGGINPIVTNATGIYQFLIDTTDPACAAYDNTSAQEYSLRVVPPGGYAPGPSEIIPPCSNLLEASSGGPWDVQNSDNPPAESAEVHNINTCPSTTTGLNPINQASTQYYLRFNLTTSGSGASGDVLRNHIPIDPILGGAIRVIKTSPKVSVTRGELVPYKITATNTVSSALSNIVIDDQIPAGFQYVSGSAQLNGIESEPEINGRQLRWAVQDLDAGEEINIQLLLVVGSGVGFNEYINRAWAMNNLSNTRASNIASATVRVVPDPIFDCTDIIGQVFDDKNRDGYQNEGEPGIPGVRLASPRGWLITTDDHGRFHVACADLPNELRGGNFILKLDERSLPSGYRVTTENPRVVRITQGRMTKLNFGAAIHRVIRLDLTTAAFDQEHHLLPQYRAQMHQLLPLLHEAPSILRIAYQLNFNEDIESARSRIDHVRLWVKQHWEEKDCCYDLLIEEELIPGTEQREVLK